jgi:hypothetical protein
MRRLPPPSAQVIAASFGSCWMIANAAESRPTSATNASAIAATPLRLRSALVISAADAHPSSAREAPRPLASAIAPAAAATADAVACRSGDAANSGGQLTIR